MFLVPGKPCLSCMSVALFFGPSHARKMGDVMSHAHCLASVIGAAVEHVLLSAKIYGSYGIDCFCHVFSVCTSWWQITAAGEAATGAAGVDRAAGTAGMYISIIGGITQVRI